MRLIDADALDNVMYHEAFENDDSYDERNPMAKWDSGLWIRYKMFENAIANASTIKPKCGEWIPCEERLPEADGLYLATFTLIGIPKFSNVESFKNGKWEYHDGYIIAWQPLPKPWKGIDDD